MFTNIRLQHFRSYKDELVELGSGVNIVVGPNASGKTNLLEGLLVVAGGRSYRADDADLVMFKTDWARLDAELDDTSVRTVKLEVKEPSGVKKSFIIDEVPFMRLSLQRVLPVVVFEPEHLRLFSGSPERRRAYLDELLEQTEPGFLTAKNHYRRALQQRNSLLKQDKQRSHDQLFVWNLRLSELGAHMAEARMRLLDRINEQLTDVYSGIAGVQSPATVSYISSVGTRNYSSVLLKKLEQHTELDYARGFTAYGPHRDDFEVLLNGHPAGSSASRGESRSLLLSLKVIETQILEDIHGKQPLLLLDDVFSELDGARRHALTQVVAGYQSVITTTDADAVIEHFMDGNYQIIPTSKT